MELSSFRKFTGREVHFLDFKKAVKQWFSINVCFVRWLVLNLAVSFNGIDITSPNCALDRRIILCLFAPGFQRQDFKHVKCVGTIKGNESKQEEQRERPSWGIRLIFPKSTVLPVMGKNFSFCELLM